MDQIINSLQINELEREWVETTWKSTLKEVVLPAEIDPPTVKKLQKLADAIKSEENDVSIVSLPLLSYLSAIILTLAEWEDPDQRAFESSGHLVVTGVECYLSLLSIPRAAAYNAFHPVLFEQAVNIVQKLLNQFSGDNRAANSAVSTAIQKRVFPVLGQVFNHFLLPVESADRPIDDFKALVKCATRMQFDTTELTKMYIALLRQKVSSIVLPQIVQGLNGTMFEASRQTLKAHEKRMCDFMSGVSLIIGEHQPDIALMIVKSLVSASPERQLNRKLALTSVTEIFQKMAPKEQQAVIDFGAEALSNAKSRRRILAIELVRTLLVQENINNLTIDPGELVHALARRTRDSSAIVQALALTALSELLEGSQITVGDSILAPGALQPSMRSSRASIGSVDSQQSAKSTNSDASTGNDRLCERAFRCERTSAKLVKTFCAADETSLIKQLLGQANQTVRKAAMVFLKSLVVRQLIPMDEKVIEMAKDACQDKLLSVRRNAIRAFTQLVILTNPLDQTSTLNMSSTGIQKMTLHLEWLQMILDKLHDSEKTVKEEAVSMLYEHLMEPLSRYNNHQMWDALHDYPAAFHEVFQRNLSALVSQLTADNKMPRPVSLVRNIWHQFELHEGNFEVGWIMMRVLYAQKKDDRVIDHDKVSQYFLENVGMFVSNFQIVAKHAIELMADMVPKMSLDIGSNIRERCQTLLTSLTSDKIELCASIARLMRTDSSPETKDWIFTRYRIKDLRTKIRKLCETNAVDQEFAQRADQITAWAMTYSEFLDLATPDDIDEFSTQLLGLYYQTHALQHGIAVRLPVSLVNTLIHVQCRICALSQRQAEFIMPFFGNELQNGKHPNTRAIALSALADLCQIKTQLVDKFMDVIAATLDDPSINVRITALQQLTNLLKKDFVKLRSSILCRMLIQAADDDEQMKVVSASASYCLKYVLLPRNGKLFYQNFSEIMMLASGAHKIDGHNGHTLLSTQTQAAYQGHPGNYPGPDNRSKRQNVYDYCIQNMDDMQRVQLMAKLAAEVLDAPQQHGQINTAESAVAEILYDSINLLHTHELLSAKRFSGGKNSGTDVAGEEDEFDPEAAENTNKSNLRKKLGAARLTLIFKHIFPVLYDLRETMRMHRSSVQPHLLRLMSDWLEDVPGLVDCDRKYAELAKDLPAEIAVWEDEEVDLPPTGEDLERPATPQPPSNAEMLSASLRNINVSLHTPAGEKRRRTFGGSAFENSANIVREKVRRISLGGKTVPASTPFHPKKKGGVNLARASLGSGISEIPRNLTGQNETVATEDSDSSFVINTGRIFF